MRMTFKLLPLLALGILTLATTAPAQLQGLFEPIGPVPAPHSLSVVRVEEYINFTCPHCNNFREVSKPLFAKYGKRVERVYVPILFRGQADAPLRLFFVGERAGRAEEVQELIFDATFRYGVNINDPQIVSYLARSAGLAEQFQAQAHADWVDEKIRDAHARADAAGVTATPTLVLSGSLRLVPETGMQAFVGNLDQLIAQLLK
jgi:protein-disulfide isomerase